MVEDYAVIARPVERRPNCQRGQGERWLAAVVAVTLARDLTLISGQVAE